MAKLLAHANLKIQERSLKDKHKEPNTMRWDKLPCKRTDFRQNEKTDEREFKRQRGRMRHKSETKEEWKVRVVNGS